MKKSLLLALALGLSTYLPLLAQTYTIKNLNFPVQHADVSAVDIDRDGDYDLLISGDGLSNARVIQLFRNDGAGNYTAVTSPFVGAGMGTIDWGDVNSDGRLDMVQSGFSSGGPYAGLFKSDAGGTFTQDASAGLSQIAPSIGIADLNNDGYDDIYVFGNKFEGKSKIFFNNKTGGFTPSAQFEAFTWVDPQVTEIDFDKDGDIDLFVMAGHEEGVNSRFSKMFVNNNGVFTVQDFGLIPKGYGSAEWGDYNGDGFLDLLLNGDGFLGSGEDRDDVYRLYRNNTGTSFTAVATFESYRQISVGDGSRFADWDNDGDLDIIVTGWNGSRQATAIFLNNAGTFTEATGNANLPGVSESSIEVTDIDGDSDLDLVLTGFSGNTFPGGPINDRASVIVVNPATTVNLPPTAPTNLVVTGNSTALTFTWNAATDATTPQNSLSYNLFVVDKTGKFYTFPLADTTTGKLIVQKLGNTQLTRSWTIKGLPEGNYRWGVQAIDNSYMGSPFTKSEFSITSTGTLPVILSSFNVFAEGGKARLDWTTVSEQNNDRFEVERSSNGRDFYKLSTVKGQGNSIRTSNYVAYDHNPSSGVNYYRLIQYNSDGRLTIHGVKKINFSLQLKASVVPFPNPSKGVPGIRLSNYDGKKITVMLSDIYGKLLHKEIMKVDNSQGYYKLNLTNNVAAGEYILQVTGEGLKENLKVLIQ